MFPSEQTRLGLIYSSAGALVGFSNATVHVERHGGRDRAVYIAGVFFRLGYHGGADAAYFGLSEALAFKLRHPTVPLAYMTRASNPAVYRGLARTIRQIYPVPNRRTPPEVEALLGSVARKHGSTPLRDRPWLVPNKVRVKSPARLRQSASLRGDPHARYFVELNPRYAEDELALLVWVPLDVGNIARSLAKLASRTLRLAR